MKTSVAIALSTLSLSALASGSTLPPEVPDQVVASFTRMLDHPVTSIAVKVPESLKAESDPLRASVNTVLWEQPSYHLPTQYAFHSVKQEKTN